MPAQLVWSANIGLKRKLALIPLFGGAVFIMMACTIRAVVILEAGPEGAATGSQWACRETFVAVVVTNLLIIYPLIRQGAKKVGLSVLFSRGTTKGQSHGYPLDSSGARAKGSRNMGSRGLNSYVGGGGGGSSSHGGGSGGSKWKAASHPLSTITRVTGQARESDEDIILDHKDNPAGHSIVVSREFTVETETGASNKTLARSMDSSHMGKVDSRFS